MLSTATPRPWPIVSLILNLLNAVSFAYDCDVHASNNCGWLQMRICVLENRKQTLLNLMIIVDIEIWQGFNLQWCVQFIKALEFANKLLTFLNIYATEVISFHDWGHPGERSIWSPHKGRNCKTNICIKTKADLEADDVPSSELLSSKWILHNNSFEY